MTSTHGHISGTHWKETWDSHISKTNLPILLILFVAQRYQSYTVFKIIAACGILALNPDCIQNCSQMESIISEKFLCQSVPNEIALSKCSTDVSFDGINNNSAFVLKKNSGIRAQSGPPEG